MNTSDWDTYFEKLKTAIGVDYDTSGEVLDQFNYFSDKFTEDFAFGLAVVGHRPSKKFRLATRDCDLTDCDVIMINGAWIMNDEGDCVVTRVPEEDTMKQGTRENIKEFFGQNASNDHFDKLEASFGVLLEDLYKK